jgi:hypothetical protein
VAKLRLVMALLEIVFRELLRTLALRVKRELIFETYGKSISEYKMKQFKQKSQCTSRNFERTSKNISTNR